uniref:Calmodulin n=1 Tax=Octactis speculum TaxID=3111310 RepID=A0A7S2MT81_9STRA
MLSGYPPYDGPNEASVLAAVKAAKPVQFDSSFEKWSHVSGEAKAFIRRLLKKNPKERPSAAEALRDPWFATQGLHTAAPSLKDEIGPRLGIFHSMNMLKKMASRIIAESGTLEDADAASLRRIFDAIDTHNTGTITKDELQRALLGSSSSSTSTFWGVGKQHQQDKKTMRNVDTLFTEIDQDGGKTIDYHEFVAAAIRPAVRKHSGNIRIAFDFFDRDRSGFITVSDMTQVVGCEAQAARLIREADYDHDQRIDFSEFEEMMNKPDFKPLLSDTVDHDLRNSTPQRVNGVWVSQIQAMVKESSPKVCKKHLIKVCKKHLFRRCYRTEERKLEDPPSRHRLRSPVFGRRSRRPSLSRNRASRNRPGSGQSGCPH